MRRGLGWSSIWTDIDLDGDLDLFTANAEQGFFGPSRLLRNDGPANDGSWSFHDLSTSCFCTDNYNPMGVSSGDWNNDGLLDLFLTNTGENQLLQNAGDDRSYAVCLPAGHLSVNASSAVESFAMVAAASSAATASRHAGCGGKPATRPPWSGRPAWPRGRGSPAGTLGSSKRPCAH